jgi:hypothetical protein
MAEVSRTKWDQWRGLLWPLGATVLSLLVLPVAIEQYPEFFRDNEWILPGSVILVLACWMIPLFVHHRAQKLYSWIVRIKYVGWLALILVIVCGVVAMWAIGARLFRFHRNHLDAAIRESQRNLPPPSTSPQPQPSTPKLEPQPKPQARKMKPKQPVGPRCNNSFRFTQKGFEEDIGGTRFGELVTIFPQPSKQAKDLPPVVILRGTATIIDGRGLGVLVATNGWDPVQAGISVSTGIMGLSITNSTSAQLWLQDVDKFQRAKAVDVMVYSKEQFRITCVYQEPSVPFIVRPSH